MANAYFVNATPFTVSLNLNVEQQNHPLVPYEIQAAATSFGEEGAVEAGDASLQLATWPTAYQAFPSPGVLGSNGASNVLVVFPMGSSKYQAYEIFSTVSTVLDVFIYVLGDTLVGSDQTGSTSGITISKASQKLIQKTLSFIPFPKS